MAPQGRERILGESFLQEFESGEFSDCTIRVGPNLAKADEPYKVR